MTLAVITGRPAGTPGRAARIRLQARAMVASARAGAVKPPRPAPIDERSVDGVTWQALMPHFTAVDRRVLRRREAAVVHVLAAARAGEYADALVTVAALRAFEAALPVSPVGRVFFASSTDAAAAYVHYRRGQAAEAFRDLSSALAGAGVLADVVDSPVIECRRVHLATNWLRVSRLGGDARSVVGFGLGLLAYVAGDDSRWPLPQHARVPDRRPAPDGAFEYLAGVLAGELAETMALDSSADSLFLDRIPSIDDTCEFVTPPAPAGAWLRLTIQRLTVGDDAFLRAAIPFLETSRREANTLWDATLFQAWRIARRSLPGDVRGSLDADLMALTAELPRLSRPLSAEIAQLSSTVG